MYPITNTREFQEFMAKDHHYDKFIVQSLVGNASWFGIRPGGLYHVGTVPNKKNEIFVCDLRVMVTADKNGFKPVAIYGRRAKLSMPNKLDDPSSK